MTGPIVGAVMAGLGSLFVLGATGYGVVTLYQSGAHSLLIVIGIIGASSICFTMGLILGGVGR